MKDGGVKDCVGDSCLPRGTELINKQRQSIFIYAIDLLTSLKSINLMSKKGQPKLYHDHSHPLLCIQHAMQQWLGLIQIDPHQLSTFSSSLFRQYRTLSSQ